MSRPPRALSLVLLVLVASVLAGCSHEADGNGGNGGGTTPTGATPTPAEVRIVFGGRVVDARTGAPLPDAALRLDLAQPRPCQRPGVLWTSYDLPVAPNGSFGPLDLPAPATTQVAFFLHAQAPNHTVNVTFIGPAESRRGVSNLTITLHEDAAIVGTAPPGTVVALNHPGFPRLAVADDSGNFSFPGARVHESAWVAATFPPVLGRAAAPANLTIEAPNGSIAWRLEGAVRGPEGQPLAADVVAWNGSVLASAARSGPDGNFTLPLKAAAQDLLVEARTPEGQYGGVLRIPVEGPPAMRQSLLLRALC